MSSSRIILHIDGDSFFASCEQALNPELRGKPVVTGHERGIATALSPQAKVLGVLRGMPLHSVRMQFPEVHIVESHYHVYRTFARRVFAIVRRETDIVEEYSIDECFADITHCEDKEVDGARKAALRIQDSIARELGITVSVGIAPTKVLAKLASKRNKPQGFLDLVHISQTALHSILESTPVSVIWGVGGSHARTLRTLGITTAYMLCTTAPHILGEHVPRPLLDIRAELCGESRMNLSLSHEPPLSLTSSRTFRPYSRNKDQVWAHLIEHCERVCEKLRKEGLSARAVSFFIREHKTMRRICGEYRFEQGVDSASMIAGTLRPLFERVWNPMCEYRATGITVSSFEEKDIQPSLFSHESTLYRRQRISRLSSVVDSLNRICGRGTVGLASARYQKTIRIQPKVFTIPSLGVAR